MRMKTRTLIKISLDLIMTVLFIFLLNISTTGLSLHEIIGLFMGILFAVHLFLNHKWIKGVGKNLFRRKLKPKTLGLFLLNLAMLVGVLTIIITGVMISKVVFPGSGYDRTLVIIHRWSSYITGLFILYHLLSHSKYLFISVKGLLASLQLTKAKKVMSGTFAILMILAMIYYYITSASRTGKHGDHLYTKPANSETTAKKNDDFVSSQDSQPQDITLNEFLSKMFCGICPRHCPLSSPQCGRSRDLIEEASEQYQNLYR